MEVRRRVASVGRVWTRTLFCVQTFESLSLPSATILSNRSKVRSVLTAALDLTGFDFKAVESSE